MKKRSRSIVLQNKDVIIRRGKIIPDARVYEFKEKGGKKMSEYKNKIVGGKAKAADLQAAAKRKCLVCSGKLTSLELAGMPVEKVERKYRDQICKTHIEEVISKLQTSIKVLKANQ